DRDMNDKRPLVTILLSPATKSMVLGDNGAAALAEVADVRFAPEDPAEWDLPVLLADATACLTGWGTPRLSAELLEQCSRLGLIAHTAGSIRNLVPEDLVGTRVRVCQSAAVIALSVAEHTLTQMLVCLRQVHLLDRGL